MSNRKHLPIALTTNGNCEINSTLFAFKDSVTILPGSKKGKLVLLLSTLHQTNEIAQSGKSEIIGFYNQTKTGVDALDQKVCHYLTYRKTKRWSQAVFYNILDIAAYNAFVLFHLRPPAQGFNFEQRARYKFLSMLGEALIKPNIIARSQLTVGLHATTTQAIEAFGVETQPQATGRKIPNEDNKKGRCHVCTRKQDRKSRQKCCKCNLFVCNDHAETTVICSNCIL